MWKTVLCRDDAHEADRWSGSMDARRACATMMRHTRADVRDLIENEVVPRWRM
jgi:hypothetical protein